MIYSDLNIPYTNTTNTKQTLTLILKLIQLGYTSIAHNHTIKPLLLSTTKPHNHNNSQFPLANLISTPSPFSSSVSFHRNLLNVAVSSPLRQYTRVTVVIDNAGFSLSCYPVVKSFDFVAVRPVNQLAFDHACLVLEVDMIAIDFTEKLPFRLKQSMVNAAVERGVYFEITYSGLISDAKSRREIIANCKLLVDWTRGKNLVISSAATSAAELRGPLDVANLVSLLGLPMEHAKAAISKNCRSLLANALRKKNFYKESVKVEEVTKVGQMNPEIPVFDDDWLKCDSISGDDGDLQLDDMKKSFATSFTIAKSIKTPTMNGLQISDLMSVDKATLEPPNICNQTSAGMKIGEADGKGLVPTSKYEGQKKLNPPLQTSLSREKHLLNPRPLKKKKFRK